MVGTRSQKKKKERQLQAASLAASDIAASSPPRRRNSNNSTAVPKPAPKSAPLPNNQLAVLDNPPSTPPTTRPTTTRPTTTAKSTDKKPATITNFPWVQSLKNATKVQNGRFVEPTPFAIDLIEAKKVDYNIVVELLVKQLGPPPPNQPDLHSTKFKNWFKDFLRPLSQKVNPTELRTIERKQRQLQRDSSIRHSQLKLEFTEKAVEILDGKSTDNPNMTRALDSFDNWVGQSNETSRIQSNNARETAETQAREAARAAEAQANSSAAQAGHQADALVGLVGGDSIPAVVTSRTDDTSATATSAATTSSVFSATKKKKKKTAQVGMVVVALLAAGVAMEFKTGYVRAYFGMATPEEEEEETLTEAFYDAVQTSWSGVKKFIKLPGKIPAEQEY